MFVAPSGDFVIITSYCSGCIFRKCHLWREVAEEHRPHFASQYLLFKYYSHAVMTQWSMLLNTTISKPKKRVSITWRVWSMLMCVNQSCHALGMQPMLGLQTIVSQSAYLCWIAAKIVTDLWVAQVWSAESINIMCCCCWSNKSMGVVRSYTFEHTISKHLSNLPYKR